MLELILGGVKSGKSRQAAEVAGNSGLEVIYVATATAGDTEMAQRIARHKSERPDRWGLVEEPLFLADVLNQHCSAQRCLLVDCLTLWFSNLLLHSDENLFQSQTDHLLELLPELPGHIILVSNETSLGVIPANELSRKFCDAAGLMHQRIASLCDRVTLQVAGLPLQLKG